MNKKVLLGMSGGVDSSVSAILLNKMGYDVLGVTMKLFDSNCDSCCSLESSNDAKKICAKLGCVHYTINYKKEFKEKVINNFIDEYRNQRTPNPCIRCNRYLKFDAMYKTAKELNIDYIATGHYAIVEYSNKYKKTILKKSKNKAKDQSYVLYNIPKDVLEHVMFPLGNFDNKDDVRKIAKDNNFIKVANKPDSEDICFIKDCNCRNFLSSIIDHKDGNIIDLDGNILGKHNGLYNYTIGQRKGLGISSNNPLYVLGFNKDLNVLIVGEKEKLYKKVMYVNNINLLLFDKLVDKLKVNVKIRYSSNEESATIEMYNNEIKVVFDNYIPRITPGQSAVFYLDDIVVGGGIIDHF